MSLGSKLTLWLLIPLLAVLIVLATITLRRERDAHYRQAATEVERIVNALAIPDGRRACGGTPQPTSPRSSERSTLEGGRFGLAVYDRAGHPFFTWGLFSANRSLRREDLAPVLGLPRGVGKLEEIGGTPVQSHLLALRAGETVVGGLKITMGLQEIQALLTRERNAFLATLAAITLILIVLISALIHRTVSQPLARLTERIAALSSGQPFEEVAISGRDEVAQLSAGVQRAGAESGGGPPPDRRGG